LLAAHGATVTERGEGAIVRREARGGLQEFTIGAAEWSRMVRDGLVLRDGEAGAWRLTREGRGALRRLLSTAGEAPVAPVVAQQTADRPGFNGRESPLVWLYRRKDKTGEPLISAIQFAAGERLRSDFERAQLSPRVTASWDLSLSPSGKRRAAPGFGVEPRDSVIAAGERVKRALAAAGPDLAGLLLDVCCFLRGLEEVERSVGLSPRSGKHLLQVGLSALARHYGMDPAAWSRADARIRHWGMDGYRPAIDAGQAPDRGDGEAF
jgi:hypothetical protein